MTDPTVSVLLTRSFRRREPQTLVKQMVLEQASMRVPL